MNIFATSICPLESAIALDNRRLIKMILESAQMLSTGLWQNILTKNYLINIKKLKDDYQEKPYFKIDTKSNQIIILKKELQNFIYKPTHINHPCSLWAANNIANWMWLFNHFIALGDEYSYRYDGKQHKSINMKDDLLNVAELVITDGELSPFANATRSEKYKIDFRNLEDTHQAYRFYLSSKWKAEGPEKAKWKFRKMPDWFKF